MKLALSSCVVAALLASANAFAADAPAAAEPAPAPEHTFTANVGVFSQYIFRGVSQTKEDPSLQGGFDYAHSSGLYIGTWASNISWLRDSYTDGTDALGYKSSSLEWDMYGGYKNTIGDTGLGYDVGLLYYYYPGRKGGTPTANTLEAYGALSWKWFTAKYSYGLTDEVFQYTNADGSWYLDLAAAYPIGETGVTAGVHWGRQHFEGSANSVYSYNDWRASLAYDMGKLGEKLAGTEAGVMYTKHTQNNDTAVFGSANQFTGYIKRTF
ncbi:MAG: TorF family putative porin [Burkholderiales bacterium]|jgi:uncharacterized protein (TIGR02001 family)